MLTTSRHRGLWLVQQSASERQVQAELERLDPDLFLLAHDLPGGRKVYEVFVDRGDRPARRIVWWADDNGKPLPLTMLIVDRVKSLQKRSRDDERVVERTFAHNAAVAERVSRDAEEAFETVAAEVLPYMSETRSGVLPRSQALRLSRDRQRARGKRI